MKKVKYFLTLLSFISLATNAQIQLSGEVRPRTNYAHGFKALAAENQEPGFFTSQRTRLNFLYGDVDYKMYICLQDVRVWGATPQLAAADGISTTIHEAWGIANFNKEWSLKLGRQEINLDDQRIFGGVGWAQQARSHDAAILQYSNDSNKTKFQLAGAYNQNGMNLIGNQFILAGSYKTFQYAWFNKGFTNFNVSLLALNLGQDAIKVKSHETVFNQTVGTRISFKKDKVSANLAFYHQMGFKGDTVGTELNGNLLSIDGTLQLSKKIAATLGYEYISGQSQTESITNPNYGNTLRAFTPYFGTNHKFNGYMDYFYVGNHIGSVGLQDISIKATMTEEKWNCSATAHIFSAAADVLDKKQFSMDGTVNSLSSNLGTEIDLTFNTNIAKGVNMELVYCQMFGSETMVALKGGSINSISNWFYAMFTFKPTFYKN